MIPRLLLAGILFACSAGAAPFQLLSLRNSSLAQPLGGNGDSVSPSLTPDGRFVLLTSGANDLVPGGNSLFALNLYVRDRFSNTTVLASGSINGTGGGNDNSINGIISTNGRWVVFQSDATDLMAGDTNSTTDIFLRDVQTGSNVLVSVAADGGWANGASTFPAMTPDGRYVAFFSQANNLVPNDTNGIADIFVRDLVSQTTVLVTVGALYPTNPPASSGVIPTGPPAITPDGTRVAFYTRATNLVAGVPSTSGGEVYVRDLMANQTTWVSTNAYSKALQTFSSTPFLSCHPLLSDDGRFVFFKTEVTSAQKPALIFKFDMTSNSIVMLTNNCLPLMFNDDVYGPEISPDGRWLVAALGAAPDPLKVSSSAIYLFDTAAGTNVLVSVRTDGLFPTNSASHTPVMSPDGRFIAFVSNATNLVNNTIISGYHIYLRDVVAGTTTLVDADTNGIGSIDQYGNAPSLSADGNIVAFASGDGSLVDNDQNHFLDSFVRNISAGTNEMISPRDSDVLKASGNGLSSASQVSMTPDGRWAVFSSFASDLVTNDFNQDQDVFVRDLVGGATALVSVGSDSNASARGYSGSPVISSNGQFVAFFSTATNLTPGSGRVLGDIFLRDLVAGTNVLVSVSADGVSARSGSSTAPVMSQDGRYVAFLSTAGNLVSPAISGAAKNTFWRDVVSGTTLAITKTNVSAAFSPSISSDGRFVAYSYPGGKAAVWDTQTATNIYISTNAGSAVISPDGKHLLYQGSSLVVAVDLATRSNVVSMFSRAPVGNSVQWSGDGRFFTFVAASNTFSGPFSHGQIYFGDLQAGTVALVSSTLDHSTGGNAVSDSPALSGNGRYLVYRSAATDIAVGASPGFNLILFDRTTGSNTVVSPGATNTDWTSWIVRPQLDDAGQTVVFQSIQSNVTAGDINRVPDVFAGQMEVTHDSDGDGIPDWWMTKYFGHPSGSAADNSRAQDDADGDGFTNLAEFLTGSDPTDSHSSLHLEVSSTISGSQITLSWVGIAGKSYQVQYKNNLNDPSWQNLGTAVVATPSVSITVPITLSTSFYRLVLLN